MKLREYSREKAKTFVISWTFIFFFFSSMAVWFLLFGIRAQMDPRVPVSPLWPHWILMAVVLFSLLVGTGLLWKRYLAGKFDKLRSARNIPFFVLLFLYPLGVILNILIARF